MPRPVPGPGALVSYIQTGSRDARVAYRDLPEKERVAYRNLVSRVYGVAIAHHLGDHPSEEAVWDLIDQVAARHPQYAGGVKRVLRSPAAAGPGGGMSPRQILTAQHLVIREIAKLHQGFRRRADEIVRDASKAMLGVGGGDLEAAAAAIASASGEEARRLHAEHYARQREQVEKLADLENAEFTGADDSRLVSVTIRLDGTLLGLELRRGVERIGGKAIIASLIQAWVAAEKQRWISAKESGVHDSFPEIGSGKAKGDSFRVEAYSDSRLCRATVDRYGRLRAVMFMRTALFERDGRDGLTADIRQAITAAQAKLGSSL
ncbi:hypothetical protein AB0B28_15015 [Glycomyces sp. NPDC046736]|uniref:hypothetical protein n=1 Tax=Glycomyces sp. NPDC046736 TaxID=3155615 RepID=UPI0033E0E219